MSSPLVQPPVAKTKALSCPNCGGPIELRGFGHALTAVCPQCLGVLDASSPDLKMVQQVQEKQRCNPLIPMGTRGKFGGTAWEAIGFQTRTVYADGEAFIWDEYLLFNPYKGFRYITQYCGHWNFVTPLEAMPTRLSVGSRPAVSIDKRMFRHFSGADATTSFVLGEFPWRVRVGEKVVADDFVDPPTVLSSETTAHEVTWSRGEYTPGSEIWKAFALPGSPPSPQGVYLNQPSPHKSHTGVWKHFFWLLMALIVVAVLVADFSSNDVVFQKAYTFSTADTGEPSFVTPVFELKGHTAGLELSIDTNLSDNWAYFNLALINQDNGQGFDFGREVSYYSGVDSDGSWSEGGRSSSVFIPSVPPGHYYLRVEPEMEAPAITSSSSSSSTSTSAARRNAAKRANTVSYTITLRHDVPNYTWFWIAALLLLIPPMFIGIRGRAFETKRWMQSDYPPVTTSSSSD
jgi:hypothetical protein